jgi:hypothetical protein
MSEQNLHFGGEAAPATHVAIGLMICFGILILVVKRKYEIYPFLFGAFFIPFKQAINIGGAHFQMLRFLAIFGLVRLCWDGLILRKVQPVFGKLHPVDRAFIYLTLVSAIALIVLNKQWAAVTSEVGTIFNALGIYFLLRFLIRDEEDVLRTVKALTLIGAVAAVSMLIEHATFRNFWSYAGGVSLAPDFRDAHVRAQAFFAHSIIAGCYGAVLLPFSVWLWLKGGKQKKYAVLCFLSSTVMTIASWSSTPIMTYLAGISAFAFWPLRKQMRWIRRGIVAALIFLHLVMHGPVWSLIDHIDIVGGNSANHRYHLVDACIRHFWDWWLIGTNDNANWGFDMWDTANTFVGTAETGGLLALILMLAVISRSFRSIGQARAHFESDKIKQMQLWSIGAAIFAECTAFFGISYYDQTIVAWYALLAIAVGLTSLTSVQANREPVALKTKIPQPWRSPAWSTVETGASSPRTRLAPRDFAKTK